MAEQELLSALRSDSLVRSLVAKCRFPDPPFGGDQFWCAVSGGSDSSALALLGVAAEMPVGLIHVDHGLRPGSDQEAGVVGLLAERLGVAFVSHQVQIGSGPNLEERARQARYGVLPAGVWTGHTADDLAETVLINLLRGAGPDGVASMARLTVGGPRRPLLGLRRTETVELCQRLGVAVVADPMNDDPAFLRVRVRHHVMALLSDVANRDVATLLARHAEITAADVDLLDELSAGVDPGARWGLRGVAEPLARRAIRRWLVSNGVGHGRVVDAASVDRVLAVALGDGVACEVDGGWRVARRDGRLCVEPKR